MAVDPGTWVKTIIDNLLNIVVWPVFFGASIVMLIWAGFMFLTAHGDPGKIAIAQKAVIWAIVGIAVAIIAFSAVNIIKSILPS